MSRPRLSRFGRPEPGYVDNLHQILASIRPVIRARQPLMLTLDHPSLREPIQFDVIPDGIGVSLVRIAYGGRELVPPMSPVDPAEMDRSLETSLRRILAHCQKIDRGLS